jgi:16S rRNA (guanine527-N7)-methyltransferase
MNSTQFSSLLLSRATAACLSIDEDLLDRLWTYFKLLAHWNARINLTGFSLEQPTARSIDRLLIEPLQIARSLTYPLDVWLDLGSGGGSPAIPIQLYRPANLLVLVESRGRKAAFLREVARELRLRQVEVEVIRIESIAPSYRFAGKADLVTVRAVRPSVAMFVAVRNLLQTGGRVALIGSKAHELVVPAGFQVAPTIEFGSSESLVVLSKSGPVRSN